jgi:hypothetical protein
MLTLSVPFPAGAEPWSTPVSRLPEDFVETHKQFLERVEWNENRYEVYDLLPEFPSLRYVCLSLLECLGTAEYVQLQIRGQLDKIAQMHWPVSSFSGAFRYRRISYSFYRSTSFHMLRLPVQRSVASDLLKMRDLSLNEKAIEAMSASLLNELMAVLGLLAIVVPIALTVVPHFLRW